MPMLTAADPAAAAQMPAPGDPAAAAQLPAPGDPAVVVQPPASADAAAVAQVSASADASGAGVIADPESSELEPLAGQGAAHASPPDHAVARGLAEHGAPEQAVAKGLDKQDPSPIASRENGAEASRLPKPPTSTTPDTQAPTQNADRNAPTPVAAASAPVGARPEAIGLHRTGFAPVVQPVAATIHVLTSRGAVHARLHLRPEELGGVEIALRTTADGGVSARLVADNPHAARVLSERLHDLTSALARQGIALTDVEVRTAHDGASRDGRPAGHAAHGRRRAEGTDSVDDIAAAPAATQTIVLDGGSIVDVLA
jgi:hypothetical protein